MNDGTALLSRGLTSLSVSLMWFLLNPQAALVNVGIFNSLNRLSHTAVVPADVI